MSSSDTDCHRRTKETNFTMYKGRDLGRSTPYPNMFYTIYTRYRGAQACTAVLLKANVWTATPRQYPWLLERTPPASQVNAVPGVRGSSPVHQHLHAHTSA